MAESRTTHFLMTIDTEEEWDWNGPFESQTYSLENIQVLNRFQQLCASRNVATTYFVSWAVLHDEASRSIIQDLAEQPNVEMGMHIHPWNTPPVDDSITTPRGSYLHNLPERMITAKLETVFETFLDAGITPTSFRGGRYSTGDVIQDYLQSHGFVADASVVPYTTWKEDGAPDYRDRGPYPVRARTSAQQKEALWELPLTLGFTRGPQRLWAGFFNAIEHSGLSRLRLIGLAQRLGLVRRVWLNFEDTKATEMLALVQVLRKLSLPFICFTVHSSSLLLGKNPYSQTQKDLDRIWSGLDTVFGKIATWQEFEPATASQLARRLEADPRARNWN